METHHLFHLSSVYSTRVPTVIEESSSLSHTVLIDEEAEFALACDPDLVVDAAPEFQGQQGPGVIFAGAIQMVFAERRSQKFITPEEVDDRESWAGKACLETLASFQMEILA